MLSNKIQKKIKYKKNPITFLSILCKPFRINQLNKKTKIKGRKDQTIQ